MLTWRDFLGAVRVRLDVNRMNYSVEPGIYAVGNQDGNSPVFVSANYKLSFDWLRKELGGVDAWMLVLDTKGVNVWCAAGKGTFGTDEVINRVRAVSLEKIVSHRRLIVPQLGAVGVAAHVVRKECGFSVVYGPVRACDIKAFLAGGMKTTPEMRRVRFDLVDRLVVVPVEIVHWLKYAALLVIGLVLISGFSSGSYDSAVMLDRGVDALMVVSMAFLAGSILVPLLLPLLPGRAFSLKGLWAGLACWAVYMFLAENVMTGLSLLAGLLVTISITSFMAMNFTGCSTFTSQAGVKREMKFAIPLQILSLVAGIVLWVVSGVIKS